ncbi:VanZ family protein [Fusibacter sp. 3D3]|uniref:VanZ family protein n=1 Tax=Fusibacter sp. 3D3 TaxID=1048380 RepID=UPI001586148D|nr:VanZ family protein [Fusibacter sp. 3D3]
MNIPIAIILSMPIIGYIFYNVFILKDKEYFKYIFMGIFMMYILGLLKYSIMPIYINSTIAQEIHKTQSTSGNIINNMNLIPFFKGFSFKDFFLNVIMTFPMGFLLPCINKKNISQIIKYGIILGLGIEIIQILLGFIQGFTFRNININDSIANVLGVFLGYLILTMFVQTYIQVFKNSKNKLVISLLNYLETKYIRH